MRTASFTNPLFWDTSLQAASKATDGRNNAARPPSYKAESLLLLLLLLLLNICLCVFVLTACVDINVPDFKFIFNYTLYQKNSSIFWKQLAVALFLDAYANLRKSTVSFFIAVCSSVLSSAWNNSVPNKRTFMTFGI